VPTSALRIGVTLGDPSGVGPEIVARTLGSAPAELRRRVVVFGDAGVLVRAAGPLPGVKIEEVTRLAEEDSLPGRPSPAGGAAQVAYLEAAVQAALGGAVDALVTAPLSKTQARAAGFAFPGHTELLAERFGAAEHAMMLAGPRLRVVLATIHLPLAEVPARLGPGDVARAVFLGGQALARDFAIARPRLGVCGLNPHAGEGGLFGDEEARLVAPGLEEGRRRLAALGLDVELGGPLVPDAAFRQMLDGRWDLIVALYHDQGLIPVKLIDFEEAVNVTLGLPIVRTSPDHGVGYDVAGTDRVRAGSFAAALALADVLGTRRAMMLRP
jgi:4-hydroxythreonine-4-phosphate dehydrogenase